VIRRIPLALSCAALVPLLALLGCVSQTDYDSVRAERDLLREEKDRLSSGQANLDSERVKLLDQLEDFRTERDVLKKKVEQLSKKSSDLEVRSVEFGQCENENQSLKSTYEALVTDLEAEVSANRIEIERLRTECKAPVKKKKKAATGAPATTAPKATTPPQAKSAPPATKP
jgi:chromosome segregation ATPase